jgi:hypothetical protein
MLNLALISPDSTAPPTATPSETDVLAHSRRPAILTYASPLVDTVNRVAAVPFFLLGFRKEAEKLDVRMMEGLQFARGWRNVPKRVRFVARFVGLRYTTPNPTAM